LEGHAVAFEWIIRDEFLGLQVPLALRLHMLGLPNSRTKDHPCPKCSWVSEVRVIPLALGEAVIEPFTNGLSGVIFSAGTNFVAKTEIA
jgi:hypothetical protein